MMASIVEIPGIGKAIKLNKESQDLTAIVILWPEILNQVSMYENRGRVCLLPKENSTPLDEINSRINEKSRELIAEDMKRKVARRKAKKLRRQF